MMHAMGARPRPAVCPGHDGTSCVSECLSWRHLETAPGSVEISDCVCDLGFREFRVVVGFVLAGRDMAYLTVESAVVVPVDPLGGGQLDLGERLPGSLGFDQLGFVQADRRFHQGVGIHRRMRSLPALTTDVCG